MITANTSAKPLRVALVLTLLAVVAGGCSIRPEPQATPLSPNDPARIDRAHELAYRASNAADPIDAMRLYAESVDQLPGYPAAWNNLGVLLMEQNRNREAGDAFEIAARSDPTDPRPMYNLGLLYHELGHHDQAKFFYERAIDRDPSYAPALIGHVRCEVSARDVSEDTLRRIDAALTLVNSAEDVTRLQIQRQTIESLLAGPSEAGEIR